LQERGENIMDITLAEIAAKLEKTDMWKIYFDIEENRFLEFADEYDESIEEQSEEEVLQHVFEVEDNWQRYVPLPDSYELDEHAMMKRFADLQEKEEFRKPLEESLRQTGALRCFKKALKEHSLTEAWQSFRQQEFLRLAEEWCYENEIEYQK
jgi:hypothetical protein